MTGRPSACLALLLLAACAHGPRDARAIPPAAPPANLDVRLPAHVGEAVAALPHLQRLPDDEVPCGRVLRRVPAWQDTRNGLEFVLVPAGTFTAGAQDDGLGTFADAPPRALTVAVPFLVCRTELTVRAARAVGLRRYADEADGLPATRVDHGEALTICGLLGYDLPTEREWEWAARGALPDGTACGDAPPPTTGPALVGAATGARNALGLLGCLGNAYEWCRDRATVGGVTGFAVRGGAHDSEAWRLHPARRDVIPDGVELAPNVGFRPVIRIAAPSAPR